MFIYTTLLEPLLEPFLPGLFFELINYSAECQSPAPGGIV